MKPKETIHCDCDCNPIRKHPIEEFNETTYRPYMKKMFELAKTEDKDVYAQLNFIDKCSALTIPNAINHSHVVDFTKRLCKEFNSCIKNEKIPFHQKLIISRKMVFTIPSLGTGSTNDKRQRTDETFKADAEAIKLMQNTLNGTPTTLLPAKKEIYIAFQEAISNTLVINKHYNSSISGDQLMRKVNILSKNCRELMARKMF